MLNVQCTQGRGFVLPLLRHRVIESPPRYRILYCIVDNQVSSNVNLCSCIPRNHSGSKPFMNSSPAMPSVPNLPAKYRHWHQIDIFGTCSMRMIPSSNVLASLRRDDLLI